MYLQVFVPNLDLSFGSILFACSKHSSTAITRSGSFTKGSDFDSHIIFGRINYLNEFDIRIHLPSSGRTTQHPQ